MAQQEEGRVRRGSRIINDTLTQVYGPNTSKYFYESDVFINKTKLYSIDTAIWNFHRYGYIQRYEYLYTDLGNMGTAIRPIYYKPPETIGVRSGFDVYDVYWDVERLKLFDTKSPYSNLNIVLGGRGRSKTKVMFSRNINPRWNFGFNYRTLLVDKQFSRQGKGDRNVRGTYYDLYTSFLTKDSAYQLSANFRRHKHIVNESGGIFQTDDLEPADYFSQNARPALLEAQSRELRTNFHLFHQYRIGSALQLYHMGDLSRQMNGFDDLPAVEGDYYDFQEIDSDTTHDRSIFKSIRNEVGIKGNLLKLFYNGYLAIRNYDMAYNQIDEDTLGIRTRGTESYLGGRVSLELDSLFTLNGNVELMQTGNYRIQANLTSRWLEASLLQMQYTPSFVSQVYRGAHDVWNNNFENINMTRLAGTAHLITKNVSIHPGLSLMRIGNYVFFKDDPARNGQRVLPQQVAEEQVIFSPEFRVNFTLSRHVHLETTAIYSRFFQSSADAFQIPELFVNTQLSYANIFFNGNLDMHAGVDIHWQSDYYAYGYDVPVQQFYVQRTFASPSYYIIDLFFNAKIKRARIFVRYNNLIQAFTQEGYFPTPYYPGQRNLLDFGFDWSFYD